MLSFVPPDGKFKLMEYRYAPVSASSLNQVSVPFILRPAVKVDDHGGMPHVSADIFLALSC